MDPPFSCFLMSTIVKQSYVALCGDCHVTAVSTRKCFSVHFHPLQGAHFAASDCEKMHLLANENYSNTETIHFYPFGMSGFWKSSLHVRFQGTVRKVKVTPTSSENSESMSDYIYTAGALK